MSDTGAIILAIAILLHPIAFAFVQGAVARTLYYQVKRALIEAAEEVKKKIV